VIFDLRLRRPAQRPSSLAGQDIGKIVKYLPLVPLPIRLCARIVADLLRLFTSAFCPDVFSIGTYPLRTQALWQARWFQGLGLNFNSVERIKDNEFEISVRCGGIFAGLHCRGNSSKTVQGQPAAAETHPCSSQERRLTPPLGTAAGDWLIAVQNAAQVRTVTPHF
jgi:hypothetical protein